MSDMGIGLDLGRKKGWVEIQNDMYVGAVAKALIEVGIEGMRKEMQRFSKMPVPVVTEKGQERIGAIK